GYPEALCQPGVTLARAVLAQRDARRLEEQVAERIKTVSNRAPQDVDGQHRSPRDMDATPLPPVNIDRDGALRRLGGNEKLVAKMSARFRETQSDVAARIREAVTRGDVEGAMREAHTLKGLAGNIGAGDIAGMAAKLDAMLKINDEQGMKLSLHELDRHMQALVQYLSLPVGSEGMADQRSGAPLNRAALTSALHRIVELIDGNETEALRAAEPMLPEFCGS